MSSQALRQAWADWCSFAESLDLSGDSSACAVLHGRLFKLCGNHALNASELAATRDAIRVSLSPWFAEETGETHSDLERLRQAMTVCEPGWRAILGMTARQTDWREVERVARAAGLTWPAQPLWNSPLHTEGQRFDLLAALRGRDHAASMAFLDALLRIHDHPLGDPLFEWARSITRLTSPAESLHAAALFRDAVAAGALREEWLAPLGWQPLPALLLQLCQDVTLCFLQRLNEPAQAKDQVIASTPGTKGHRVRSTPFRRAVPDPLPIAPFFQKIPGSEGFLLAISEEPLEDAHRLAFADWLEEHGQPDRARFIRLQCEDDALPAHPLARRRIRELIADLFKKHGAAWKAGIPRCLYMEKIEVEDFRRGFLERVEFSHPPEPKDEAKLLEAIDVRALRTDLYGSNAHQTGASVILDRPWASRLVSLEVVDCYGHDIAALASSEKLARLVHFGMVGRYTGTDELRALAESFQLTSLISLDLSDCRIRDEGVGAIASGAMLNNIRFLSLAGRSWRGELISLPGVRALAACPAVARLEHLDLSMNKARVAGVESLAASPYLANLKTLILDYCQVGARGAKAIASSPFLKQLTCLSLSCTGLSDEGVRALARSASLAGLTVLDLSTNQHIRTGGIQALATSPHLSRLRALSLANVSLTLDGVKALAESPHLANLDTLDLSETRIDDQGARALAASPHLNNLAFLDLTQQYSQLTPAAKAAVRKRWRFARM